MIEAKIVADSISPKGVRLTTMQLTYPRMIHAEFMTHRKFSRNASSSRAIPVKRLIDMATEDPAFFSSVRYNEAGMQGAEELSEADRLRFRDEWEQLMKIAASYAQRWAAPFSKGGYNIHKQHVNRVMEPWHHIKVVCTSTEWENFFHLRDHPAAEPTIRVLAQHMRAALNSSSPVQLFPGEWHLPYVPGEEIDDSGWQLAVALSTARCARVSYMRHDGTPAPHEDDVALHDRLVVRGVGNDEPAHMSPSEHQAMVAENEEAARPYNGNLDGDWIQYRKTLEHQYAL